VTVGKLVEGCLGGGVCPHTDGFSPSFPELGATLTPSSVVERLTNHRSLKEEVESGKGVVGIKRRKGCVSAHLRVAVFD
jgi:hypothetical protein